MENVDKIKEDCRIMERYLDNCDNNSLKYIIYMLIRNPDFESYSKANQFLINAAEEFDREYSIPKEIVDPKGYIE
jgi:hypothetical protein